MLKTITSLGPYSAFINGFVDDGDYYDPHFANSKDELYCAFNTEGRHVLAFFDENNAVSGIFVLMVSEYEKYMEILVALSRSETAYKELLGHICTSYVGFGVDAVFAPDNAQFIAALKNIGAVFYKEQQKFLLKSPVPFKSGLNIMPYTERFRAEYIKMHSLDVYWTAERVLEAKNSFRIILATDRDELVGYMDVTANFDINEPYDLFVKEGYHNMGYEKALIAKALELNGQRGMQVIVDVDDEFICSAYTDLGFEKVAGQNSITAHFDTAE